ncbi:MAG TPA: hypothetical protein VIL41_02160 [Coriobacteriia bacterium]
MTAPLFYEGSLGAKAVEALRNLPSADDELLDDPAALEAAQAAVNAKDPDADNPVAGLDWIAVYGPERLGGTQSEAEQNAAILTMPLDAEGIPYAWDPFPPQGMYVTRGVSRPFTLLVAPDDGQRARELVRRNAGGPASPGSRPRAARPLQDSLARQTVSGLLLALILLLLLIGLLLGAAQHYHVLSLQRLIP